MTTASGKKLIQTVIHNTNTASHMQSITVRMVLGGTAMAAGAAYHISDLRKEIESVTKKTESAHRTLEIQTKEMESMRREYDAKFENIKEI
jgi:hypothetical protein